VPTSLGLEYGTCVCVGNHGRSPADLSWQVGQPQAAQDKTSIPEMCARTYFSLLVPICLAERDQLQQDAEDEAELEAEQEDMVDSPAKRQRVEQGAGRQSRCGA
jgi:hypothetical protein